ncbi:MAG: DUF1553 domain-containing protein [Planctomycetales bacterium]|nr:DUF1553 domain-containing protein [Planctomycetales bacterium]
MTVRIVPSILRFFSAREKLLQVQIVCFGALVFACAVTSNCAEVITDNIYEQEVRPLFKEKCISCHGANKAEGGLRLDAIQLVRGVGGSKEEVQNGNTVVIEILERVVTDDLELKMPPADGGSSLTDNQVQALRVWFEAGMPGPDHEEIPKGPAEHWAYQAIVREFPANQESETANPIDIVVRRHQEAVGVSPLPATDSATWLRRVTFDVTGLPPTPEQLRQFCANDTHQSRRELVDQLLASSTYGQRWARHWMDIWRYSDWDGYKEELRGSQRHIWHWRDWIVESLNENKPYGRMVEEMLAGDELAPDDPDTLRATGFLARNFHKSNRNIWLDATVEHTGKAFFGLTLNCARCHDHKYDPIAQPVYYQLRSVFEPHQIRTDQIHGISNISQDGIPRAYDARPDEPTYVYRGGNEKHPVTDSPVQPGIISWLPGTLEIQPIELPLGGYYPALSDTVHGNQLHDKRSAIQVAAGHVQSAAQSLIDEQNSRVTRLDPTSETLAQSLYRQANLELEFALADQSAYQARFEADSARMTGHCYEEYYAAAQLAAVREYELSQIRVELDLLRAQVALASAQAEPVKDAKKQSQKLEDLHKQLSDARQAKAGLPAFVASTKYTSLGVEYPHFSTGRRLALAKWITSPGNPLTARVAVNHMWMRHFDQPLVENVFDFGMNCPKPVQLELLDWLAAEFLRTGWDMKHLHRLILLSDTYAQSSDLALAPPENLRIDKHNQFLWMNQVRRLDAEEVRDSLLAVGGKLDCTSSGPDIDYELGETVYRRSLYFRHAYEKQMSMLVLFDAASPNECYRRSPSLIPQQALVLSNSVLARDMANSIALASVRLENSVNDADFVTQLFESTLGRLPISQEMNQCLEFLGVQGDLLSDTDQLHSFGNEKSHAGSSNAKNRNPQAQARASLALVLMNHNDFLSLR